MNDDVALLRRYADEKSEAAFAEFVRRHLDLVYSAALRRLNGDAHAARDVAQQVFTALARDPQRLARHTVLTAWLYTATRNAAIDLIRSEQRRATREQEATAMHTLFATSPDADWDKLRPVLDAVMDELPDADRSAVLLRFFEKRPFAEIGATLAMTEDAARMRVDRALEKLRALLARRGVTSTGAALATVLSSQVITAAPAGLAGAVTSAALAGASMAGGVTAATLGIFSMSKPTVLLAAALLAVSGTVVFEFNQSRQAEAALAAVNRDEAGLRARLRAAEQRAAEADQDLASLQRAVESARAVSAAADARAAALAARSADPTNAANSALFTFLGAPVPPPANLDSRYSPESLAAVFTELSKANGLEVQKLSVDDSEYPYLVYGTIVGGHELKGIQEALGTTPGYRYIASVTMRGSYDGGPASTFFAMNIIPDSRGTGGGADRRMMLRLQMLRDKAMKSK